jgi:DNA polymerase-3 subunit chi
MGKGKEKVAEFIELRSPGEKLTQVCIRTALHYERGETVSIYAPDEAEASALDDLLWTFRQNSFVPHVRLERPTEPLIEPVIIFSNAPEDDVIGRAEASVLERAEADVLILASAGEMPAWLTEFDHIYDFAEVYDEKRSQAARGRFAACKTAGYRMRFLQA